MRSGGLVGGGTLAGREVGVGVGFGVGVDVGIAVGVNVGVAVDNGVAVCAETVTVLDGVTGVAVFVETMEVTVLVNVAAGDGVIVASTIAICVALGVASGAVA